MVYRTEDGSGGVASLPPLAPQEWSRARSSSEEQDSGAGARDKKGAVRPPRDAAVASKGLRSRRAASLGEDEERVDRITARRVLLTSAQRRAAGGSPTSNGGVSNGRRARARRAASSSPEDKILSPRPRGDSEDDRSSSLLSMAGESAAEAIVARLGGGALSPLRSPMRRQESHGEGSESGGSGSGGALPAANGVPPGAEKDRVIDRRVSARSWASLVGMAPAYVGNGVGGATRTAAAEGVASAGGGVVASGGDEGAGVGSGGDPAEGRLSPIAMNSPLSQMVMVSAWCCYATQYCYQSFCCTVCRFVWLLYI